MRWNEQGLLITYGKGISIEYSDGQVRGPESEQFPVWATQELANQADTDELH